MAKKVIKQTTRQGGTRKNLESSAESSRIAELAGLKLSEADAAWVANKVVQRRAAAGLVRELPFAGREPANTFAPPRYD